MFILVFDQSSIHCALCMYVCFSVSLSECVCLRRADQEENDGSELLVVHLKREVC